MRQSATRLPICRAGPREVMEGDMGEMWGDVGRYGGDGDIAEILGET